MSTEPNPYAAPLSHDAPGAAPEWVRPKSPKVIGIISIVFSVLGILSLGWNVLAWSQMVDGPANPENPAMIPMRELYSPAYFVTMNVVSGITTLLLLAAGIGLVRYRVWGRTTFFVYATAIILFAVVNAFYMWMFVIPNFQIDNPAMKAGLYGGAIGGVIGACLFPLISVAFLVRERVAESLR